LPETPERGSQTSAWESVLLTRRADRPGAADLIRAAATDLVPLREDGLALVLARVGGRPCVLAAQDRTVLPHGPETLRTAQRGLQLAAELRLPFAQHAWLAPLAPEGASVIVYKDTAHAAELAARQGIRATDLAAAGIVDHVVAERDPGQLLADLGRLLNTELASLTARDDGARLAARHRRYRQLGTAHSD
jgi:acetyl-CoA carboxylase alpha subunit